jgi:hypothetical protein
VLWATQSAKIETLPSRYLGKNRQCDRDAVSVTALSGRNDADRAQSWPFCAVQHGKLAIGGEAHSRR